jgi:hypothetical protein
MSRYYRRQLWRTFTLLGLTVLSVLASAGAALAQPSGWMW